MSLFNFLATLLSILLSLYFFNSCSGAFSRRNQGDNTLLSTVGDLPEDTSDTSGPHSIEVQNNDNPKDFNYFPYDLKLDTIAYLTCEYNERNNPLFTLKAGSYFPRSGLRLSNYFLKQAENLSKTQLTDLIKSSTKYRATPELRIFEKNNIRQTFSPIRFNDIIRLHEHVLELVNTNKERIQKIDGEWIEARFEQHKQRVNMALDFNGEGSNPQTVLSVTYFVHTKDGKPTIATQQVSDKKDFNPDDQFYGRQYELRFSVKNKLPGPRFNYLNRYVLESVKEVIRPITDKSKAPVWICPNELKLEVRRNDEDKRANEPGCPPESDKSGSKFKIVDKILNHKHNGRWDINISQGCIAPQKNNVSCYYNISNDEESKIAYDDGDCKINPQSPSDRKKYCPHFLSICIAKDST